MAGLNPLLASSSNTKEHEVEGNGVATSPTNSNHSEDVPPTTNEEDLESGGSNLNNRRPMFSEALTRRRRRNYTAVPNNEEEEGSEEEEEEDQVVGSEVENGISIVILDSAQQKFNIEVSPSLWTVGQLKSEGEMVHKVPPSAQRLIFRGKLLQDALTLEESGIVEANTIIHLFPRPRVVVQEGCSDPDQEEEETGGDGAHIPQIVLDPREAEQRASILVLGSTDFIEAQNNVKLFSFLLLVVSTLELVSLFGILVGIPVTDVDIQDGYYPSNGGGSLADDTFSRSRMDDDGTDFAYDTNSSTFPPSSDGGVEYVQWEFSNNFDLLISMFGVWVAMTGLQASNENKLRLAQQYLWGTILVGTAWMAYNFWVSVQIEKEDDLRHWENEHSQDKANSTTTYQPFSDVEYYQKNLSVMFLPGMVWFLCCVRAWQFQYLLGEAEREAVGRIQSELEQHANTYSSNSAEDVVVSNGSTGSSSSMEEQDGDPARTGNRDLELQDEFSPEGVVTWPPP